jgi:NADH:ubiquinone oxidoreductase subunit B-like Fe-S oxidoreductase
LIALHTPGVPEEPAAYFQALLEAEVEAETERRRRRRRNNEKQKGKARNSRKDRRASEKGENK